MIVSRDVQLFGPFKNTFKLFMGLYSNSNKTLKADWHRGDFERKNEPVWLIKRETLEFISFRVIGWILTVHHISESECQFYDTSARKGF